MRIVDVPSPFEKKPYGTFPAQVEHVEGQEQELQPLDEEETDNEVKDKDVAEEKGKDGISPLPKDNEGHEDVNDEPSEHRSQDGVGTKETHVDESNGKDDDH